MEGLRINKEVETVSGHSRNKIREFWIEVFDWRLLAAALVIGGVMAVIQFSGRGMVDIDAYYHTKMAYLMQKSLTPEFTWLPLTILSPQKYVDHHWLFHILLIPFTYGDLVTGGKIAAVVFSTLAFTAAGMVLKAMKVPAAWLWTLALLAAGGGMLFRLSMTRGQSLSLLWMMLTILFLFKRHDVALFFTGLTYVWLYNAFPLFLVLVGVYVVLVWIFTRELRWRTALLAGAGVVVGLTANPFFPRNLQFIYEHYIAKLDIHAVSVGAEWYPYTTTELLKNASGAMIAFLAGILGLGINRQRINLQAAFFLILSILFGYMVFQSKRFIEYFPLFPILFCAVAWQPLIPSIPQARWAAFAAGLLIAAVALINIQYTRDDIGGYTAPEHFKGSGEWLTQNTPAGAMVFQTDWDDFPRLFFYDSHNTFIVGLDPTYLSLADQKLFNKWVDLTQGRSSDQGLAADIKTAFNACYAVSDLEHGNFIRAAERDPSIREVFRDETSVVYKLCP